jgi:2-methylcitrate dehydratase PrpD
MVTRRNVLQLASWVTAAAALPRELCKATAALNSVMSVLSGYMSDASGRALPDEVTAQIKLHTLDTMAAMVSGSTLYAGRKATQFASDYGGEKIATVVGSDVMCGPIEAALVNGVLAHADETNDVHRPSRSQPGSSTVPAALAVGEKFGISGMHFLRAVTLGYDIGPRVTIALGPSALASQGHKSTFSIAGTFGAAAAAGCAAGLSAQQMRWLLDYAAQQASGIEAWHQDTDHIENGFVLAGMPARSGVTAALLVHSGWNGVDDILSGPDNFLLAFAPESDPTKLVEQLGERYEVTRADIKKWSVGMPIQAPLDALEMLIQGQPFDPERVQELRVHMAGSLAGPVNNSLIPDLCLQHLMAVMLRDKTVSFQAAHDKARMQDPAILELRSKVRLVPDEDFERRLPRWEATVELILKDGTVHRRHIEDPRGTVENPMTREEVAEKARSLMQPVLGASVCRTLIERVLSLEETKDIRELRPLISLRSTPRR